MKPNPNTAAGRQCLFEDALAIAHKHYGVVLPEIMSKLRFPEYVRARGDIARHLYMHGVIIFRIAELLGLDPSTVTYYVNPRSRELNRAKYRRRLQRLKLRHMSEVGHAQTTQTPVELR